METCLYVKFDRWFNTLKINLTLVFEQQGLYSTPVAADVPLRRTRLCGYSLRCGGFAIRRCLI